MESFLRLAYATKSIASFRVTLRFFGGLDASLDSVTFYHALVVVTNLYR